MKQPDAVTHQAVAQVGQAWGPWGHWRDEARVSPYGCMGAECAV